MPNISFSYLSWNIQNFGSNDNKDLNLIANIILDSEADIVIIDELYVNRSSTVAASWSHPPQPQAIKAAKDLLGILNTKNPKGNWLGDKTNANCTNANRDAYALFYKSTPNSTNQTHPLGNGQRANHISIDTFKVQRESSLGEEPTFAESRRPGGAVFTFKTHSPNQTESCAILGIHAFLAKDKHEIPMGQGAIKDCVNVAAYTAASGTPTTNKFVVGGDFNLSYKDYTKWYTKLSKKLSLSGLITVDGASTLKKKVTSSKGIVAPYLNHAYDNFLSHGLIAHDTLVRNEIAKLADDFKAKNPAATKATSLRSALKYYNSLIGGRVSDHLPILGVFEFP